MREQLRKWWPALKIVLTLAFLFFIGRTLARDLADPQLWHRSYNPVSLLLSGALYLAGLGCAMLFWGLLLRRFGQRPTLLGLARGYYIGLLGKYVPGKAWALLLRATFVRNPKVSMGLAVQTGFFEVLIMMSAGAVLGCVLFVFTAPDTSAAMDWQSLVNLFRLSADEDAVVAWPVAILFAAMIAVGFLTVASPPVFNRIVNRVTRPFQRFISEQLPRIGIVPYLQGLPIQMGCWLCMGASFWFILDAVYPAPPDWTWNTFSYVVAATAISCVAGFVILIVPSGLGVREFLLVLFLRPLFPGPATALAVVVVRLVWTMAEVIMAGALYVLAPRERT